MGKNNKKNQQQKKKKTGQKKIKRNTNRIENDENLNINVDQNFTIRQPEKTNKKKVEKNPILDTNTDEFVFIDDLKNRNNNQKIEKKNPNVKLEGSTLDNNQEEKIEKKVEFKTYTKKSKSKSFKSKENKKIPKNKRPDYKKEMAKCFKKSKLELESKLKSEKGKIKTELLTKKNSLTSYKKILIPKLKEENRIDNNDMKRSLKEINKKKVKYDKLAKNKKLKIKYERVKKQKSEEEKIRIEEEKIRIEEERLKKFEEERKRIEEYERKLYEDYLKKQDLILEEARLKKYNALNDYNEKIRKANELKKLKNKNKKDIEKANKAMDDYKKKYDNENKNLLLIIEERKQNGLSVPEETVDIIQSIFIDQSNVNNTRVELKQSSFSSLKDLLKK